MPATALLSGTPASIIASYGGDAAVFKSSQGSQAILIIAALLVIYGLGFAAVYLAMTLLYLHAYRLRDALQLTELEKFDTRYQIFRLLTLVAFGLIAALLAYIPITRNWSSLPKICSPRCMRRRAWGWRHRKSD